MIENLKHEINSFKMKKLIEKRKEAGTKVHSHRKKKAS